MTDHYVDAVFSEPGRCWRMIQTAGVGAPDHCSESVAWVGNHRLSGGKQIRVWSCEGHREGLEEPEYTFANKPCKTRPKGAQRDSTGERDRTNNSDRGGGERLLSRASLRVFRSRVTRSDAL